MKKLIFILTIVLLFAIPVQAEETYTILIHIQNAPNLYIMEIHDENVNVKTISNKTFLPIPALDMQSASIEEVNFSSAPKTLCNTISYFTKENIPYYVSLSLEELMNDLEINTYNLDTLSSLCDLAHTIKEKITIPVLLQYKKYINTNLSIKQLMHLYSLFQDSKMNYHFYHLFYFCTSNYDIPLETTFYLQNK